MKKTLPYFLTVLGLLLFIVATRGRAESRIEKEYDKNGILKHSFEILDSPEGTVRGIIREYYTNGVIKSESPIKESAGELGYCQDGEVKSFYFDGTLQSRVRFTSCKENGPFSRFYQNGELRSDGTFSNGVIASVKRLDRNGLHLSSTNHIHLKARQSAFTKPQPVELYCDINADWNGRLAWVFLYKIEGGEWIEKIRNHDFSPQRYNKGETRILSFQSGDLDAGEWKCKLTFSITGPGNAGKYPAVESETFTLKQ